MARLKWMAYLYKDRKKKGKSWASIGVFEGLFCWKLRFNSYFCENLLTNEKVIDPDAGGCRDGSAGLQ